MKVVTFGECLFRVATHKGERLARTNEMQFYLGGTELNIAANLKSLGVATEWVSSLPAGITGELIQEKIKDLGVDISHCETIPCGQAGWYLMETGSAPRPDIVYHRTASSMAMLNSFSFDWKKILTGAKVFHTSGVAAGLSRPLTSEVLKAMKEARAQKVLVSYDFNYRKNIWSIEDFVKYQKDLIPHIDILFCSDKDLELFFGTTDYEKVFKASQLKIIVLSTRSEDESEYGVNVVTPTSSYSSKKYKIQSVDRIGVGDSMAAGFLKSYLSHQDEKQACEWAALTGAMKYGIAGDMALLKEKEVVSILENGFKGIIR